MREIRVDRKLEGKSVISVGFTEEKRVDKFMDMGVFFFFWKIYELIHNIREWNSIPFGMESIIFSRCYNGFVIKTEIIYERV